MGRQPESKFKERIYPKLVALPNTFVEKIQQVAIRGTPDFLCCINGCFLALELKRDEAQDPDPLQTYKLNKIIAAGGIALTVYPENWEEVYGILFKLAAGTIKIKFARKKMETLQ